MRLSKREMDEAIATLFGLLGSGMDDKEAMEEMGLDPDTYARVRAAMFDAKADEVRTMPPEHLYVHYMIQQGKNIDDLTKMIDEFHRTKQYTAIVGAVRVRSEIHDKLIKVGQDFGLIKREPKVTKLVGGLVVAEMTNQELRTAIVSQLGRLGELMKAHGEGSVLDLKAGPIHRGPALPPGGSTETVSATDMAPMERFRAEAAKPVNEPSKHHKANNAKLARGRKVVKRKKVTP